jgi:hypothetical protein
MSPKGKWVAIVAIALFAILGGTAAFAAVLIGPLGLRSTPLNAKAHSTPSAHASPPPTAQASPTPFGPSPRSASALAFDEATGTLILFGGGHLGGGGTTALLDDTWMWDGTTWSQLLKTSPNPPARVSAEMVYDPERRVIVLHGGYGNSGFINDTWTWDSTGWRQMSPSQSPPFSALDSSGYQPMTWDSTDKIVLLFTTTGTLPSLAYEINQTWAWDGANWTQLPTAWAPAGHGLAPGAIAYDSARKATVFFSHLSNGTPATWTFDGKSWSVPGAPPSAASSARTNGSGSSSFWFSMVGDPARSNVVLFGLAGDTWTWDGNRWTVQHPAHSPSQRQFPTMTYDPVRQQVVLFGGETGTFPLPRVGFGMGLNEIWTWDGVDWTQVT